jgi:hypothetical protein
MNELDWGVVTPESANLDQNVFTYVFNHKLSTSAEVDRTVRFIVGRLLFYDKHLHANPKHDVKLDVCGQNLDQNTITQIVQTTREMYTKSNLREINVIQK